MEEKNNGNEEIFNLTDKILGCIKKTKSKECIVVNRDICVFLEIDIEINYQEAIIIVNQVNFKEKFVARSILTGDNINKVNKSYIIKEMMLGIMDLILEMVLKAWNGKPVKELNMIEIYIENNAKSYVHVF